MRILFAILLTIFFCAEVWAQQIANPISSDAAVMQGLMELRRSAKKATVANDAMAEKNRHLKSKILFLQRKTQQLADKKQELIRYKQEDDLKSVKDKQQTLLLEKGVERSRVDYDAVRQQQERLSRDLNASVNQGEHINEEIMKMRTALAELIAKIDRLKRDKGRNQDVLSEKRELLGLIEKSEQRISRLKNRLKQFYHSQGSLLGRGDKLSLENRQLKKEIAVLAERARDMQQENFGSADDREGILKHNNQRLMQLNNKIAALKSQRKELEAVFDQAKERLKQHNVDLAHVNKREAQLRVNMDTMQEENAALIREVRSLERVLQGY